LAEEGASRFEAHQGALAGGFVAALIKILSQELTKPKEENPRF
jgi:hypothetical protein